MRLNLLRWHLNCKSFYTKASCILTPAVMKTPTNIHHMMLDSCLSVWDTLSCRSPFLKLLTGWNSHSSSLNSLQRAAKLHTSPCVRERRQRQTDENGEFWEGWMCEMESRTRGENDSENCLSAEERNSSRENGVSLCVRHNHSGCSQTQSLHTLLSVCPSVSLPVSLRLAFHFPEYSSSGLPQNQMNTMKHLIRSNVTLKFTL